MPLKTLHYKNEDITIIWKPETCIHSTLCWKGLQEVFDPKRRPWIIADAAGSEKIKDQINKCPSGALSYVLNNVEAPTEISLSDGKETHILECMPNGPLLLKGEVLIRNTDGTEEMKSGTTALCRCGASQNKPYCDGSHKMAGFTA